MAASALWLADLTPEVLERAYGRETHRRGAAYADDNAVERLSTGDHGRMLLATVRGSGRKQYQTMVRAAPSPPDSLPVWTGRCSCPMQADCKHVVATLLSARTRLLQRSEPVSLPWESTLASLVQDDVEREHAPLGLQVEVVTPRRTRYGPAAPSARLRLRPVTPGKNGGWIKTGVSWRDLEYPYGRVTIKPAHSEAMMQFLALYRARLRSSYSYADQPVHLDELGPQAWPLLRQALQSGIQLVSADKQATRVHLAPQAARLAVDVVRGDAAGDAAAIAQIQLGDGRRLAIEDGAVLVGDPAHGLFVDERPGLLLSAFERPLDTAATRWLADGRPLHVPAADVPRFLGSYYPALLRKVSVASSDGSVEFPEILPPRLGLVATFEPGHQVQVSWHFAYASADTVTLVPLVDPAGGASRDRDAEQAILSSLDMLDVVPGLRVDVGGRRSLVPQVLLRGLDTVTFANEVLPALQERADVLVEVRGSQADYQENEEAPLIRLSATDSTDGSDWFDLGVTVTVGGQDVPFAELFRALARDEEHLILESGTWFRLDRPELHALRRLIEEARTLQDRDAESLRLTTFQAGLWEELVQLGVVEEQSERWSRRVGALLNVDELPTPAEPLGLKASLRPYQLEGYRWLSFLWDCRLGGVLADDMGLGKTVQTLAMAARAHEAGELTDPMLIVAPTSVVGTWASEAERFCPDLDVVTITETQRRSGRPLSHVAQGAQLVVTSYALLRIDEEAYRGMCWSALVLDEAQFVKNHRAKTYQCARLLDAPFKLAITGTPLENSLMDLWALLSIVAPGLFPSPQRFTDEFRKPIESGQAPEVLASLRRRIRPLMLRRTKDNVARDLPPKVEQVLHVTLNPAHQKIYQTHLQRERQRILGMIDDVQKHRIAIFRSLTLLRQLSLDPSLVDKKYAGTVRSSKIDALMEQLEEVVAEGHRALVFSQFTGFLALVRARLTEAGIDHCYLDGRTRDRPRRIAEFREGDAPVFCISLKAGGFGLTLTEADYVFVLDPWWNPAAEAQAVDRTHRIGQDKTVMVYRLVAVDTIEEKVVALQQRKRDLFQQVVEDEAMMSSPLTADDIRELLG